MDRNSSRPQPTTRSKATSDNPKVKNAKAKRKREREVKVRAGLVQLDLWLRGCMRRGIASLPPHTDGLESDRFWEEIAARMVDAQAPGIARELRSMAKIPHSEPHWCDRLLERLGRLHLLVEGFSRLEALSPGTRADIRTQIGWTHDRDRLLQQPGKCDRWWILGQQLETDAAATANLKARRVWLWGEGCGQYALLLDFAYGERPFERNWHPGTAVEGELVFHPSAYPLRGVLKPNLTLHTQEKFARIPGLETIAAALEGYSTALGQNPWLDRFPMTIARCIPHDRGRVLEDGDGSRLPVAPDFTQGWSLMALSGGEAIALFGEWDGGFFFPLCGVAEGRFVAFETF